ncbi:SWIM-type domain-containing protein [Raphanus sativus]|nr:SWIM-type domain-containing protein [Raphanus sativus]
MAEHCMVIAVLRTASLSYWPPNSKELATGLTTPPVMLTNDGVVSYFYQHFQTNKGMNLFVTFNSQPRTCQTSHVDENPLPFTTPNQPIKRTHSPFSSSGLRHPSTAGSKIPGFSLFNDDELSFSQDCPPVQSSNRTPVRPASCPSVQLPNCPFVQPSSYPPVQPSSYPPVQPSIYPTSGHPSSASQIPAGSIPTEDTIDRPFPNARRSCPAKPSRLSLIDETVLCGDEMLENMFKEDPENIPDSWVTDDDEETGSDASVPADIDDVQTRGYDEDFWTPLIDKNLGGSDAPELMAGISVPKTAPHIIHCITGDAFDHTVCGNRNSHCRF